MPPPTYLFLHTEAPTRRALARAFHDRPRPGRFVLASDEVTEADHAFYDECVVLPPAHDVAGTLAALERVPSEVLVAQTEYGLLPGALLAARRRIAGPDVQASFLATHKGLQRARLSRAGVAQPAFAPCRTAADVRSAGLGFPLVLKPLASTLGRLVRRVDREEDLEDAVAALRAALPTAPDVRRLLDFARLARLDLEGDPTREFLAEAFAPGEPLETDGIVGEAAVEVFGVTQQVVSAPPRFYLEGYCFPVPDLHGLGTASRRAVEALGLRRTGFSLEFRGDLLIEVNGRLGEDDGFPDLFEAALGQVPLLRLLPGGAPPARPRGAHAIAYRNRYQPGRVLRTRGSEGVVLLVQPGDRVGEPGTPAFAPHVAYALASHPTDAGLALAEARRRVAAAIVEFEGG